MPQILSKYFGYFDSRETEVVRFRHGLPGFEEQTEFAAISIPGQEPILYLQSLNRPELCLITLPVRVFIPDYRLELGPEEREALDFRESREPRIGLDVACQAIVTVGPDREPAGNLAAPLVINLSNRLGSQVFQGCAQYSFRHRLAEIPQLAAC